jgi:hypothetical protein
LLAGHYQQLTEIDLLSLTAANNDLTNCTDKRISLVFDDDKISHKLTEKSESIKEKKHFIRT